ncbi:Protein DGCR6L [Plecturocebus cupreus]
MGSHPSSAQAALRQKLREAQQACRPHNLPVLQAAQQRELEAVKHRICEEQRVMDQKIVLELDQKVADQQSTLKKAEVAGFYVTTKLKELMLQMNLLEFIWKLQQRGCQAGKACSGLGGWWQPPAAQCDQEGSPVPP